MADPTPAINHLSDVLTLHGSLLQKLNASVEGLSGKMGAPGKPAGGGGPPGAPGGGGGAGEGLQAVLGGFVTGVTAAVGAVLALVAAATKFVSAFNPALVELFNQSLKDLQAAIGSFLGPIVEAARGFAEQLNEVMTALAPAILPIVEQLGAVLAEVGGVVSTALLPVIEALLPVFQAGVNQYKMLLEALKPVLDVLAALAPIIGALATVFTMIQTVLLAVLVVPLKILGAIITALLAPLKPLTELFAVLNDVFGEIMKELMGVVDDLIKEAMKPFKDIMDSAISAVRGFINAVLQFLGLPQLRGPGARGEGRTQAAGEARFIDTLEIGRQARLAAAGAAGQRPPTEEGQQNQTNLLGGMLGVLENLPTRIGAAFTAAWEAVSRAIIDAINGLRNAPAQAAREVQQNPWVRTGAALLLRPSLFFN